MLYTLKNEHLTVQAADRGAELQSVKGADGTEYLWQGDPDFWRNRATNCFPFTGRLFGGEYTLDGAAYSFPNHGFASTRSFICEENTDEKLVLTLTENEETLALYPRRFRYTITYRLEGCRLVIREEVENRDTRVMPFGLGGHPGFNVPLAPGLSFEDYSVTFSEACRAERMHFTPACFPDGGVDPFPLEDGVRLQLRHELFDDDAIFLRNTAKQVTLSAPGDPHSVTVTFPQMTYVGFWHKPHTAAPYVCIEPWCTMPAADGKKCVMEEKEDLIRLQPGACYTNEWSIEMGM